MNKLTSIERISNILKRKSVDRIGVFESFWWDTQKKWAIDGKVRKDENLRDHFDFDIRHEGAFRIVGNLDYVQRDYYARS